MDKPKPAPVKAPAAPAAEPPKQKIKKIEVPKAAKGKDESQEEDDEQPQAISFVQFFPFAFRHCKTETLTKKSIEVTAEKVTLRTII